MPDSLFYILPLQMIVIRSLRTPVNLEQLAITLTSDPDYKVIRRLKARKELAPEPNRPLAKGVVIDTETTGLDPYTCKIIEIGLVAFEYDPVTGQPIRVTDSYGGLEDPGHPLSEETTKITGITDAIVAGQRIDGDRVGAIVANATIVIAHNANFDRPFLENRLPVFASLPWGCSLSDVDWNAERLGSRKLDYIAFQMDFSLMRTAPRKIAKHCWRSSHAPCLSPGKRV